MTKRFQVYLREDMSRDALATFLKTLLATFGSDVKADARMWAEYPMELYKKRLLKSFEPHLADLHAALTSTLGKSFPVYRAEHHGDASAGVRSFSLTKAGAEEFVGQDYRSGTSDTIRTARISATDVLAIGSYYSTEVLVNVSHIRP